MTLDRGVRGLIRLGARVPFGVVAAPRRPVVLMYHGVPTRSTAGVDGAVFEEHVVYLKQHFTTVAPDDIENRRRPLERCRVLLTFDDGFRNNLTVVAPILRKYDVPAMFFVCSRHAVSGKYLWFSYLRALEAHFPGNALSFRGASLDLSAAKRRESVERLSQILLALTPHPAAMYDAIERELPRLEDFVSDEDLADRYAGLTAEQVAELDRDPLFTVGNHTSDHPLLTRCEPGEALRQMRDNREWVERLCGRRCDVIAYPGGDYNADVLSSCRAAHHARGYSVSPYVHGDPDFEIPRLGIYSPSVDALGFKVYWGTLIRSMGVAIG